MKRKKRPNPSSSSSSSDTDFDFNDNEEDYTSSPSPPPRKSQPKITIPNPPQTKRKLALLKGPRSSRRNRSTKAAVDVFDSEDDEIPCVKKQGFDMLVEAAAFHQHHNYDEGTERSDPASTPALSSPAPATTKDGTEIGDFCRGKEIKDHSISEVEEENEQDGNCFANDSDGFEKPKSKDQDNRTNFPVISEQNTMDFMVSHSKKIYGSFTSQQTGSVSESLGSATPNITISEVKKASEFSAVESPKNDNVSGVGEPNKEPGKSVPTKRKMSGRLESALQSSKNSEKLKAEHNGVRRVPLRLPGTRALLKSNVESTADKNLSASTCSKVLQFQSSSVLHQRVIGLSRRVRPPPLHPYLSNTDK